MTAVERLFSHENAFDYSPEHDRLFVEAMREQVAFHRAHSPLYDGLCRLEGFEDVPQDIARIFEVPHIIVTAFKEREILSVPREEIVITYTSSGTTGQSSHIDLDQVSFERQDWMRASIVKSYGLVDEEQVNYLCFSYDPATSGTRGAARTHRMYASFAPAHESFFAISQDAGGEPRFHLEDCVRALERYAASGLPLRVTGFPAFGYVTLKALDERGERFSFPASSVLFSGGGWKLHTGQAVPYEEYVELVQRVLGIRADRIRDVYGMVEHGVPYLTCEAHRFHVPLYGRVCALDPGTLEVLPTGETGLFKLLTPFVRSTPSISVLATDFGSVHEGCPCGRPGQYLQLKGRAGVKKYDGCAISAAQLLGQ